MLFQSGAYPRWLVCGEYGSLRSGEVCVWLGWAGTSQHLSFFFNLVCGRSLCTARPPIGQLGCYWEESYWQQKGKRIEVRKSIM